MSARDVIGSLRALAARDQRTPTAPSASRGVRCGGTRDAGSTQSRPSRPSDCRRAARQVVTQSADMPTQPDGRRGVVGLLFLLFAITYIDRVCISVAGPRMQEDLGIDPVGWGWVTAMFTLAYGLFEIPTGTMGDRIGPRRVLTRIVCGGRPLRR